MSGQFGEIFQGLGGGTLMGIITLSIVFLALSGIALIIFGVKYLVAIVDASERKPKAPEKAVSVDGGKIPAAAKSAASPGGADEGEILAAISAAVAVMFGGAGKIVAIRPAVGPKAASGSAWKMAGRLESFEGFRRTGD
jgi:hypothetical protein